MRALQSLLFACFTLSASAAGFCPNGMGVTPAGISQNTNIETSTSVSTDEKEVTYRIHPKAKASEEHEFKYKEVTTTQFGELETLLGDEIYTIDSLVVNGPIDYADCHYILKASVEGYLSILNLAGADIHAKTIPAGAFYSPRNQQDGDVFYLSQLRRIILPDDVKRIGSEAFEYTKLLKHINFPASLRSIGREAFSGSGIAMNPLVLPKSLEVIEERAFSQCRGFQEVEWPSSLKKIQQYAFSETAITTLSIPDNLEELGNMAFSFAKLQNVSFPNTNIDFDFYGGQFSTNTDLTQMYLGEGMTKIPNHFLYLDTALVEVNIPHSVKQIGDEAFNYCWSLKSLELPLGVESLGKCALGDMTALEQLVLPASVKTLGQSCCENMTALKRLYSAAPEPPVCVNDLVFASDFDPANPPTVYIPKGTKEKYENATGWKYFTNFVEIDSSEFPATAIKRTAISEVKDVEVTLYDLTGRKMEHPQKGQIYISKGKKVVF